MTIKDAKSRLANAIGYFSGDGKAVLELAKKALDCSGADSLQVSDRMEKLLSEESRQNDSSEWAENVYIAALAMKRHYDCKAYLQDKKHEIDGETVSMWTSIISAIIGIIATVAVMGLKFFDIITEIDIDSLAYVISLAGWLVAVIIAVIARIVNRHKVKKHNKSSEYTVAELLAVKYEDSSKIVKAVLPAEVKRPMIYAARDLNIKKIVLKGKTPKADMVAGRDANIDEVIIP